jgi:uncharacterized protein (DUF2062 family)
VKRWFRLWRFHQRSVRRSLRDTYLHRLLGKRLLARHLWALDRTSLAGGLSLGLFVAFTPTIPSQTILCGLGAILFGVNLPVALAACWVTNPLTAVPIYLTARRLGQWLFEGAPLLMAILDLFGIEGRGRRFIEQSIYLWTGSLLFSLAAAAAGYATVRLLARLLEPLHRRAGATGSE